MIMLVSITTIISGAVYLISGFYIFLTWRKKKNFLLQTFAIFLLSMGAQMVFLTLGLAVFFDNNLISNICWWLGNGYGGGISFDFGRAFYSGRNISSQAFQTIL